MQLEEKSHTFHSYVAKIQIFSPSQTYLMSITWLTTTLGWEAFPSAISYRKSLKSQTTASALCHPFFTPAGLGILDRQTNKQTKQPKLKCQSEPL